MKNVFEKIIDGELFAKKVFENERVLAIHDIAPKAPVHILIMPKKSIENLQSLETEDYYLLGEIVEVAKMLAKQFGIERGYRLITNNGSLAGQSVFHLHFHLLGGRFLKELG
jgi:histidine triad (HIT) family protein